MRKLEIGECEWGRGLRGGGGNVIWDVGFLIFPRGCGTHLRVDWGRDCSRKAPTRAPTQVGVDAGQVRGMAESLVRYGESGLRGVTKPITGLVANIADR